MDLMLTRRPIRAARALAIGLATKVVRGGSALTGAQRHAGTVMTFPQAGLRGDRVLAFEQWSLPWPDAVAREVELGLANRTSGETVGGAGRFTKGQGRHSAFQTRMDVDE